MTDVKDIIRHYSNGEITIVWKPALCIHVKYCWKELPEVFDPDKRPWTNPYGASTERIIQQINRCPSGALTYFRNDEQQKTPETPVTPQPVVSEITAEAMVGGPLLVSGNIAVKYGDNVEHKSGPTAFCRCGQSQDPPYCDGSHAETNFNV
ncbi:hypothetical protein AGMMS50262_04340 [Bacteroidia bacterium]|nr:hypothetical protein AGMMS50262_04340 [Bacteroidia bacterium]